MRGDYSDGAGHSGASTGHPHMRGDYGLEKGFKTIVLGPSPHAWGLRFPARVGRTRPRAIPTCVGTTSSVCLLVPWLVGHPHMRGDYGGRRGDPGPGPGHPHMRGDYSARGRAYSPDYGPSPHAWGLPYPPGPGPGRGRAIPTCVGTTARSLRKRFGQPGHPHMRGDYKPLG